MHISVIGFQLISFYNNRCLHFVARNSIAFNLIIFSFPPPPNHTPGSLMTIIALLDDVQKNGEMMATSSSLWVQQIFTTWFEQGEFHNLLQELRLIDPESHNIYLSKYMETFHDLLQVVSVAS